MRIAEAAQYRGLGDVGREEDVEVLRRERDEAIAHARTLEHQLGELRGKVKRLELMMWRRTARRQRAEAWVRRVRGWLPGKTN
jgi:hypothetical protein